LLLVVHPALSKSTGFKWGIRKRNLDAAQAWGIDNPRKFDELPKDAKLDILAWYEAKWRIDAIVAYDNMEEIKRRNG
jgi:hypothetical protein